MRTLLLIAVALASSSACASPPSPEEAGLAANLLDWAIKLSGYPRPATAPSIDFVSQAFFEASVCGGRHCRVWGWYPNTGEAIVYVHESARDLLLDGTDPRSVLAASIVVHEFTHYLQAAKRDFASYECNAALALEREAYGVQNAYIAAQGSYLRVGLSMHNAGCSGNAHAAGAVAGP